MKRVIFSLLFCAACAAGQVREDTARLLDRLGQLRGRHILELTAQDYGSTQNAYLAWVDARVQAKRSVEEMNAELSAAGLLYVAPRDETFWDEYVGYLDAVETAPIASSNDLLALKLGIELLNPTHR